MTQEKLELVNDASPIVSGVPAYPLEATLASDGAAKIVGDPGFAAVARAMVEAHKEGTLPDCSSEDHAGVWKKWVNALGKQLGLKGKNLFMPLRIAATGSMAGPDIAAQLHVLSLASGASEAPVVPLGARMEALEAALVKLPQPEEVTS